MKHMAKSVWRSSDTSVPRRKQIAALCCRSTKEALEVLLITSRDTGRWVIPKGWPMDRRTDADAALQEAWEEAGVAMAEVSEDVVGTFDYNKGLSDDCWVPVTVDVYLAKVTKLADDFPERAERKRAWVTPAKAASLVHEPELQDLLRRVKEFV